MNGGKLFKGGLINIYYIGDVIICNKKWNDLVLIMIVKILSLEKGLIFII